MIHALNPYGYRNNRRCTKNNIDLNRNYLESNNFYERDYPYQIFKLVSTYLYSFHLFTYFFQFSLNMVIQKHVSMLLKVNIDIKKDCFMVEIKKKKILQY